MTPAYVVLCFRVCEHPTPICPGSEIGKCSRCDYAVWLSPGTKKVLARVTGGAIRCMRCRTGERVILTAEHVSHLTVTRN